MSDELNKYPGNLKHHKVDGDIDEDTALLISNLAAEVVRLGDARAKDAELIQRLVDYIAHDPMDHVMYYARGGWSKDKVLSSAASAGYKQTQAE